MDRNIEGKSATSISLKHSTHQFIKQRNINLSAEIEEWLENKYMDNNNILQNLLKEKEVIENKIELIKKQIEADKVKAEEELKNLSELNLKELRDSLDVIDRMGGNFLGSRKDRYNLICEENVTLDKFKWLLEKIRNKYGINNVAT